MSIEERLAEYRLKKRAKSGDGLSNGNGSKKLAESETAMTADVISHSPPHSTSSLLGRDDLKVDVSEPEVPSTADHGQYQGISQFGKYGRYLTVTSTTLKFALWVILMILFIELEFGAVFFVLSAFYVIYKNLRSGPKKVGEPSAYSVFNPNCEAIDGTLKAEQFERELRYGALN